MNRIDFTQPGGFPFTQETLGFMQSEYISALNALASAWASAQGVTHVILSGCTASGGTVSPGVCAVNGELMYCAGGSGSYVRVVETPQNAVFQNGNVHPVYLTRVLMFQTGTGQIAWSSFVRIPKTATSAQGDKADSAVQSATVGGVAVPKAGTQLQMPAYPKLRRGNGTWIPSGNSNFSGATSLYHLIDDMVFVSGNFSVLLPEVNSTTVPDGSRILGIAGLPYRATSPVGTCFLNFSVRYNQHTGDLPQLYSLYVFTGSNRMNLTYYASAGSYAENTEIYFSGFYRTDFS